MADREIELKFNTSANLKGAEDTQKALAQVRAAEESAAASSKEISKDLADIEKRRLEISKELEERIKSRSSSSGSGNAEQVKAETDAIIELNSQLEKLNELKANAESRDAGESRGDSLKEEADARRELQEAEERAAMSSKEAEEAMRAEMAAQKGLSKELRVVDGETRKQVQGTQNLDSALKLLDQQIDQATQSLIAFQRAGDVAGVQKQITAIQALGAQKTLLTSNVNKLTAGLKQGKMGMAGFGQGALNAAYFLDDLQYGMRGVMNNIPGLVMSLGGGMGLAGALSIVTLAIGYFTGQAGPMKKATDGEKSDVERLTEAIKKAADTYNELSAQQLNAQFSNKAEAGWKNKIEALNEEAEAVERVMNAYYRKEKLAADIAGDDLRVRELDASLMPEDTIDQKQKKANEIDKLRRERISLAAEEEVKAIEMAHDKVLAAYAKAYDEELAARKEKEKLSAMKSASKAPSDAASLSKSMKMRGEYEKAYNSFVARGFDPDSQDNMDFMSNVVSNRGEFTYDERRFKKIQEAQRMQAAMKQEEDKIQATTSLITDANSNVISEETGTLDLVASYKKFTETLKKKEEILKEKSDQLENKTKELEEAEVIKSEKLDQASTKKDNESAIADSKYNHESKKISDYAKKRELENSLEDKQRQIDDLKEEIEIQKKYAADVEKAAATKIGGLKHTAPASGAGGKGVSSSKLMEILNDIPRIISDSKVDEAEQGKLSQHLGSLLSSSQAQKEMGDVAYRQTISLLTQLINTANESLSTQKTTSGELKRLQAQVKKLETEAANLARKNANTTRR